MKIKVSNANTPNWKEVTVKSHIPEELKKLEEMARNIWWAWNYEATDLFRDLDPVTWKEVGQNPVALLERLSYEKLEALTQDKVIVKRMNDVYAKFKAYVDAKPDSKRPSVAYFCMEYGLTHVLKIYSGGLGILAGDYLKEASDSNVDMCGVGFLYRYGYFSQSLSMDGQQIANYESQNFGYVPFGSTLTPAYATNEPYYTSSQVKMANKNLGWEKTTQYNYGIDFSFLNGRISGSMDIYHSNTNDLLLSMTIPTLTGFNSTYANVGKTKNFGVDLSLNLVPIQTKDFEWSSTINAAYQKDEDGVSKAKYNYKYNDSNQLIKRTNAKIWGRKIQTGYYTVFYCVIKLRKFCIVL